MSVGSPLEIRLSLLHRQILGSKLLPKRYQQYTPVLADALCFFLRQLSPVRLNAIFAEQLQLAPIASPPEQLVALLRHVPILHKLGQVVARDRRLHISFRRHLQTLESRAPQMSLGFARRLLARDFKDYDRKAGIVLGPPLAEGSVAVVIPFVWPGGTGHLRQGVFKLLKPGVSTKLEEDLAILARLGAFLDERCEPLHLPPIDYSETFETIRELLLHEIRFQEEQRNLTEAAALYRSASSVMIPALFPFSSPRLTAMERIAGKPIPGPPALTADRAGRVLLPDPHRKQNAQVILDALVATPIFSSQLAPLFHADPHGGNLLLTADGRVGILDWSLTGRLPKEDRIDIIQLVIGGITLDVTRIEQALQRLSPVKLAPAWRSAVDACLVDVQRGSFPGLTWLTKLLDALVTSAAWRPRANLILFRKSLLTLQGVVTDLTSNPQDHLVDQILTARLLGALFAEWPFRMQVPFNERPFLSHLSTADLLRCSWAATGWWPLAGLRG